MWKPFPFTDEQWNAKGLKLHVPSGSIYLNNFINVDLDNETADVQADATNLECFSDNSVDLILASHLIEHFAEVEVLNVLREWYRVIKPGHWVIVECPDAEACMKNFLEIPADDINKRIYQFPQIWGRPDWHPLQAHKCGIWHEYLELRMKQAGFTEIIKRPAKADDIQHLCMRIDATK